MPTKIIDPKRKYTFSDYFELNLPIHQLLAYFGYSRVLVEQYSFNKVTVEPVYCANLKAELNQNLRLTTLNSETARREALIAPIMFKVAAYLDTPLEVEYSLRVNQQLGGKVDYYMQREHNLLIVEAKQGDLQRGFTQLAVELIAFDNWLDPDNKPLYGSISVGDIWRFAVLDRQSKQITEDLNVYNVPGHLAELLAVLVGILS